MATKVSIKTVNINLQFDPRIDSIVTMLRMLIANRTEDMITQQDLLNAVEAVKGVVPSVEQAITLLHTRLVEAYQQNNPNAMRTAIDELGAVAKRLAAAVAANPEPVDDDGEPPVEPTDPNQPPPVVVDPAPTDPNPPVDPTPTDPTQPTDPAPVDPQPQPDPNDPDAPPPPPVQ